MRSRVRASAASSFKAFILSLLNRRIRRSSGQETLAVALGFIADDNGRSVTNQIHRSKENNGTRMNAD
jgi:hypothetical protein